MDWLEQVVEDSLMRHRYNLDVSLKKHVASCIRAELAKRINNAPHYEVITESYNLALADIRKALGIKEGKNE